MRTNPDVQELDNKLRQVSNFPKPGINFLDMSPILSDSGSFRSMIQNMANPFRDQKVDQIIAIESRGFILGAAMALELKTGLVMIRKKGKLPGPTISVSYELEYGTDQLEAVPENIKAGQKVIIVDDVLATGGTAAATYELCHKLKANVLGFSFFIEIEFLKGRSRLSAPVHSLLMK